MPSGTETPNRENDQIRVKAQLDILLKIIETETASFLSIGSLAIALIVILSLNQDLVHFRPIESKILLSIFLILTTVTLLTHSYLLSGGKKNSVKIIEEIMGKNISGQLQITIMQRIIAYVPKVVLVTFTLSLIYIIWVLWR